MNIFGRLRDSISGPERTFVVERVEKGEECVGEVHGMSGSGWGAAAYSREIPIRIVTIGLQVDGTRYEVNAMEMLGPILRYEEYMRNGIYPKQIEILEEMMGKSIKMRSREPYDLMTLERLSKR